MKKRFLFVLAMLSALTITGCKDDNTKLGTLSSPQQITVQSDGDRSLIIFDEVANAQYYNVYINDMSVTVKSSGTGTIQFDASKIITLPQKYTIKVKAGSARYFDSEFTKDYEYQHTSILDAPVVSIDGTTLNWNKIPNAEFYDVLVTTSNPTMETTYRFPSNKFDFTNILSNKGEYLFKVKAINEGGQYISSIYSNQVKYIYKQTLTTPHNLKVCYDDTSGETLLSFVSSENVNNFTININGANYSFAEAEQEFLYPIDIENVYVIKLTSFAKYKEILIDNASVLNVSVKANTSNEYLNSSEFSNSVACQFNSVLNAPIVTLKTTPTSCQINITAQDSPYLSNFAIYLNERKFKVVSKDITQIELPLTEIGSAGIRVQAISNNNNCYSSNLSAVQYVTKPSLTLDKLNATFVDRTITWDAVSNATAYYVEIFNTNYRYEYFTTDTSKTSLAIPTECVNNQYSAKIVAIANGYNQSEKVIDIKCTSKLDIPSNVAIDTKAGDTYLTFDEVANADGYLLHLTYTPVGATQPIEITIPKLFVGSPIKINSYISEANGYKFKVKAVSLLNEYIQDGELSQEQEIQSVKTLTTPTLAIVQEGDDYYLKVTVKDDEKTLIAGYEIWIDYVAIDGASLVDGKMKVTSYLANAGQHNFMLKAKAIENEYIKDSAMASLHYNSVKQLDVVTNIKVSKTEDDGKYILTFNEQTLAAKYLVQIVKSDDETYKVEFETSRGVADISRYVVDNGVYRVYVKALALPGGFYTDSATSGNPYRLIKGETLSVVENIAINKKVGKDAKGEVDLSWDKVENALGYQVYVYYNNNDMSTLKQSIFVPQSENPFVNIGSNSEYVCLAKEGSYTIKIKAVGDNEKYETSQPSTHLYNYVMELQTDFERNEIFMYGNAYNYKIESASDLQNLLWYHYLYNQDVWSHNTLTYNLKVYCNMDLDQMASEISESVATEVESVLTDVQKMNIIARALLARYPEKFNYSLGLGGTTTQAFCLNEETNIYLFRYVDNLDKSKSETLEAATPSLYGEKLDVMDSFEKRSSNYIFAVDTKESIDVTTTEQLFMALQYNRQPNFVGDCTVAKAVYENARFVLREICSDNMSDYEKVLQIYNFLTKRIKLNDAVVQQIALGNSATVDVANLKDLYLEAILYNFNKDGGLFTSVDEFIGLTAASEGLSKTFVSLCAIEGIDSIKVDGTLNSASYSWNKVYIDIEEDGVDGKEWYALDLAREIQHSMEVDEGDESATYQVSLHKYFLLTDAMLNLQATTWHKPLPNAIKNGDTYYVVDYVADNKIHYYNYQIDVNGNYSKDANGEYVYDEEGEYVKKEYTLQVPTFNYYNYQKYSCTYNNTELVPQRYFTASDAYDMEDAMIYGMLKANRTNRVMVDVDAKAYIDSKTIGGVVDQQAIVTEVLSRYSSAKTKLGGLYNCSVSVKIIDNRYIVLSLQGTKYQQ